jgi:hypothetical protein
MPWLRRREAAESEGGEKKRSSGNLSVNKNKNKEQI